MKKYIYDRFDFTEEYRQDLIEFLKHNTNAEIGGYRLYDGTRTHLMQSPYEIVDFIFALKKHEQEKGMKLQRFLEVGFSAGINNTLLHKFFNFDAIVGIDTLDSETNTSTFKANLRNKNLVLICGDSTSERVVNIASTLGQYDLIFIDGYHSYEFVTKDFHNYLPFLAKDGVIAFHDIGCPDLPDISKFWCEIKSAPQYLTQEFICSDYLIQYGIGMVTLK